MKAAQKALLSDVQINRLITQAGSSGQRTRLKTNQFAQHGEQASTVSGPGMDFADRQVYVRGDDPRFIDWKASARSNQLLVRRYHSELTTPCCIVIDRRASMCYGTRKRLKATQAVRVGITLGTQMLQAGYQLACLLLDHPEYWQAPQSSLSVFRHTLQHAARACQPGCDAESDSGWNRIGGRLTTHLAQGSRLILISDFLSLDQGAQPALRQLGHDFDLSAVQIIDPSERQLPSGAEFSLHWADATRRMAKHSDALAQANAVLSQRLQQQSTWFNQAGCDLLQLQSNDSLQALRGLS